MFIGESDSNRYLYHYTTFKTAEDHILPNNKLKLSRYQKTNDPKERKEWFFSPGTNEDRNLDKYTPNYLSKTLNPILKGKTHVLCFSTDGNLSGDHIQDMPNRGFCKPRMWSHYGDNHKGVCLVYDRVRLSESFKHQLNDKTYRAQHVIYADRLLGEIITDPAYTVNVDCLEDWGNERYAYAHGQKYIERLYFEKSLDWSGEKEYRWVVFDTSEDIYMDTKDSLVGIMFGAEVDQSSIRRMINLTKKKTLFYQQLNWRNCTPWYDFGGAMWQ